MSAFQNVALKFPLSEIAGELDARSCFLEMIGIGNESSESMQKLWKVRDLMLDLSIIIITGRSTVNDFGRSIQDVLVSQLPQIQNSVRRRVKSANHE